MQNALRWGILGTGNIAKQFAAGMKTARLGAVVAVGSRTPASARAFGQAYSINATHDYAGLIADPGLDAIYLSLPNALHHEWTIRALRAGKHVLCEKPFALDLAQSQEMFDVAQQQGRVLVEAFMYRSHPYVAAIDAVIRAGTIGRVQLIRTSFCYRTTKIAGNVRFDRTLGGGALMDVGCYCVHFSRHFSAAEPVKIHATTKLHETGVDEVTSATMKFPNGILASFTCGMSVQADNTASICGTDGYIDVPVPWKPVAGKGGYIIGRSTPPKQDQKDASTSAAPPPPPPPRESVRIDADRDLYALEADDFAECVQGSKPPAISSADTLGNMSVLDAIREQIGLSF